jgi:hypothetical protein
MPDRLLLLLLCLQLVRGGLYAAVVPLWQQPDEVVHFEYAKLVAARDRVRLDLPFRETTAYRVVTALGAPAAAAEPATSHREIRAELARSLARHRYWELRPGADPAAPFAQAELHQPPLYYLVAGTLLRVARLPAMDAEAYLLRALGVILSLAVVGLAWGVGRALLPGRPALAAAPALVVTLLPQYSSLSAAVTNDRLVDVVGAAVFLLAVRAVGPGLGAGGVLLLPGLVTAGLLTKTTALFLLPALLSLWDVRRAARRGGSWARFAAARLVLVAVLVTLFATAPLWLPGAVDALAPAAAGLPAGLRAAGETLADQVRERFGASLEATIVARARAFPPTVTEVRRYLAVLFSGFWGNFGHMEAPLAVWLYAALALGCGAAVVGLGLRARDLARGRGTLAPWQAAALVHLAVSAGWAFLLTFARDALVQSYSQGRYLFPVLVPLAALLVLGFRRVIPVADDRAFARGLVAGLAAVDAVGLLQAVLPFFYGVTLLRGL